MKLLVLFSALALMAAAAIPDLKSEPNLEKRARLALDYADGALNDARQAYAKGDVKATREHLNDLSESIEVAHASLVETGKDARRKPKAFKYGETRTRDMLKRLDAMERAMDYDDRKLVESARAKVQEVHDAWLLGIMGEK